MDKVAALLIGSQKAGTTSLYRYMIQHPQVTFSRVKELTYFIDPKLHARGPDYLHSYFPPVPANSIAVTAHVHMLACRGAPRRVYDYNPEMKFIAVLRDPVDRAWSAFNYAVRNGWEADGRDFMDAVECETTRLESDDHRERYDLAYLRNGLYWQHLANWFRLFPRERFLLCTTDELRDAADDCLRRIWQHLAIDSSRAVETGVAYNRASQARWKWIDRLRFDKNSAAKKFLANTVPSRMRVWLRGEVMPRIHRFNTIEGEPTTLPEDYRHRLEPYFREDLDQLSAELGIHFGSGRPP